MPLNRKTAERLARAHQYAAADAYRRAVIDLRDGFPRAAVIMQREQRSSYRAQGAIVINLLYGN